MRSRVYVMVGRPSIHRSNQSIAAMAAGGFAAECTVATRYQQTAAGTGAQQQMQVASSYQKFIVCPLLRELRPKVHYKSQPNAKTPRKT